MNPAPPLGQSGFIVGPLMARRGLRKAERLYLDVSPKAYAARQCHQGFAVWKWCVITPLAPIRGLLDLFSPERAADGVAGAMGVGGPADFNRALASNKAWAFRAFYKKIQR